MRIRVLVAVAAVLLAAGCSRSPNVLHPEGGPAQNTAVQDSLAGGGQGAGSGG